MIKELIYGLSTAIQLLKHYGPPHPDHMCGTGDSPCDCICAEYADFEMEICELNKIVKKGMRKLSYNDVEQS